MRLQNLYFDKVLRWLFLCLSKFGHYALGRERKTHEPKINSQWKLANILN